MKIGFFIPAIGSGGVESSLAKLLPVLKEAGLDLTLLYGHAPSEWLDSVRHLVEFDQLQPRPFVPFLGRFMDSRASISLSLLQDLTDRIKQRDLDILVGYQSGSVALFAKWRSGVDIPVVVRESTVASIAYSYESKIWSLLKRAVKSFSFSRADAVIAVCQGASDDLVDNFGVSKDVVSVIYNPAIPDNLEVLISEPVEHPWFDASSEIPIVVSVGRLAIEKDCPTTFRAIAELLKNREIRLVMVGQGPLLEDFQSLAAELGIEQHIWFAGQQSNPYKFMAQSSVFVLTSIYEGIANVIVEALASGAPVVATDCPTGPREVLLDGKAGSLVPVGDHIAVADAINQLLDDPSLQNSFKCAAKESLKRFTPELATNAYMNIFESSNRESLR